MVQPRIWSDTDIGNGRSENQDCIYANSDIGLLILADGIGGHNGGKVASQRLVFNLAEILEGALPDRDDGDANSLARFLAATITEQNRLMFDQAAEDPRLNGMGCTLVLVVLIGEDALIANIGDSRCYHYRAGRLLQITTDHSLIQAQVDSGVLTEEEAAAGFGKNMLMRAVGVASKVEADFFRISLNPGDWLVTCSDGMLQCHDAKALEMLVGEAVRSEDPAVFLVQAAVRAGTTDNVSVQVMAI